MPFRLVSLDGGKSRNAIPRDAVAVCSVPGDHEDAFRVRGGRGDRRVQDAYTKTDPGVAVTVEVAADAADAWTEEATATLLDAVALVPTGPLAMSPDFAGLVETSTSLGEALTNGGELTLHSLTRSSNDSAMPEVIAALEAAARLGGGELRGEVQLQRLAPRPRLPPARGLARCVGAAVRQAPGGHGGSRRARVGRDRDEGRPPPRHARDRPPDRGAAFARRAGRASRPSNGSGSCSSPSSTTSRRASG